MADLVELSRTPGRVDPAGDAAEPVISEACLSRLVAGPARR
jgi:hypothetical protein